MTKLYTLLCLLLAATFGATARDVAVVLRVDETGAKTVKIVPRVVDPSTFAPLAQPALNEADSTFRFTGLPDGMPAAVIYEIDGGINGRGLQDDSDTTTIYIPGFYLKDPTELKELTVTASDRRMTAEKQTYMPTASNKRISASGTALVENIGIPTIKANALEGTMSTITGKPVSTFIDYIPASRVAVRSIRAEEVLRVEVYDFPSDPRFGGAEHVVNFVMVKYEFGGFSKLDATQSLVSDSGDYGVFSRLTYKKMTYDVGADFGYMRSRHDGTESRSVYDFPSQTVTADSRTEKSLAKSHEASAYVRAAYGVKDMTISNIVSFKRSVSPDNYRINRETFDSPDYLPESSRADTHSATTTFTWSGDYQFSLSRNTSLVLSPYASYGKTDSRYLYRAGEDFIDNTAAEKRWSGKLNATLRRMFGRNSVAASLFGNASGNDIDYSGTTPATHRGSRYSGGLWLQAQLTFGKFMLSPNVLAYYEHQKINGIKEHNISSKYYINAVYMPDERNRIDLTGSYMRMLPPQSVMTDNISYLDQINAIAGNPALKTSDALTISPSYTFMPLRQLSASVYMDFERDGNVFACDYIPATRDGRNVMIRRYVNAKSLNTLRYGLSANSFLFDNSLRLNLWIEGATEKVTGPFSASCTGLRMNVGARYVFSDFYVAAHYQLKHKAVSAMGIVHNPALYYFQAGWGNGNWQLQATAINVFSKSYRGTRTVIDTAAYRNETVSLSMGPHCRFSLSATYSFAYGKKKVSAESSVKLPAATESQILK